MSFEEETYGTEVIDVPVELVERLKGDWAERMQELSNVPVRLDLRDGTGRAHIGPGPNIGYATGQIVDSLMVMLKEFQDSREGHVLSTKVTVDLLPPPGSISHFIWCASRIMKEPNSSYVSRDSEAATRMPR